MTATEVIELGSESAGGIPVLKRRVVGEEFVGCVVKYASRPMTDQEGNPRLKDNGCLLYTSPSPRDRQKSRMPSSA